MTPVYKLSASSITGRTTYGSMLAGNTAYELPGDFESIATVTVGATAVDYIDFTSIPSTYKHLQLRWLLRSSRSGATADGVSLIFNSDTASYPRHYILGDGSSAAAYAEDSSAGNTGMVFRAATGAAAGASMFAAGIIDILDYANTSKYKTARNLAGYDLNGSGQVILNSGLWQSTSAITSIRVQSSTLGDFVQYSHAALYGIKGA